jgi:hypothetical protein
VQSHWEPIKKAAIAEVNTGYGHPYDAQGRFRHARLLAWAEANGIPWERTPTGRAVLDTERLKDLVLVYPHIEAFRQLCKTLNQMRATGFPLGNDGVNRFLLWPYSTKTSRNAPSSASNIMAAASWLRSLIQAPPGYGLAYIDWFQQEYGIAAAFSKDQRMQQSYYSGDPYLALAKLIGTVPQTATKASHPRIREQYKTVSLGVLYGMTAPTIAKRVGVGASIGQQLLDDHQRAFPVFWEWTQRTVLRALLSRQIHTKYGWRMRCGQHAEHNPRTISNFPMQAALVQSDGDR